MQFQYLYGFRNPWSSSAYPQWFISMTIRISSANSKQSRSLTISYRWSSVLLGNLPADFAFPKGYLLGQAKSNPWTNQITHQLMQPKGQHSYIIKFSVYILFKESNKAMELKQSWCSRQQTCICHWKLTRAISRSPSRSLRDLHNTRHMFTSVTMIANIVIASIGQRRFTHSWVLSS